MSFTPGQPSKVLQNKVSIISFLEQPDISYCAPGRKDTAYCGKSNGIKIYCPKHCLLYTYNGLVSLFNEENEAEFYFHTSISIENSVVDEESNLVKFPVVIISNETNMMKPKMKLNVAFSNNNKLIRMVKNMVPNISTFHFWSDGCAGQFQSQFVFHSFCYYPADITLTWNYGEAHHFKGMHLKEVSHIACSTYTYGICHLHCTTI